MLHDRAPRHLPTWIVIAGLIAGLGVVVAAAGSLILRSSPDSPRLTARPAIKSATRDEAGIEFALAERAFQQRDFARALVHAQRCVELNPNRARAYLLLAELMDELQRTAEMVEPLRKACALEPELYAAHINLAYACLFAGDLDCAEPEARWCLDREPNDPFVHRVLARIARDRGDLPQALAEVSRALKLEPRSLEARLLEADILLFQNQPEIAYQRLKPLTGSRSDRRRILATLSRAAALTGRSDEVKVYEAELQKLAAEDHLEPLNLEQAASGKTDR